MERLGIGSYCISFDEEISAVLLEFNDKGQWNKAMKFIDLHLNELNNYL
jgi:hypothetical protein